MRGGPNSRSACHVLGAGRAGVGRPVWKSPFPVLFTTDNASSLKSMQYRQTDEDELSVEYRRVTK